MTNQNFCGKNTSLVVYDNMENLKILNLDNLFENLKNYSSKKICAMVKSNAYGHGLEEIVQLVQSKVECFGVANVEEGVRVRKHSDKRVLVVGANPNLKLCKKHNLEFMIDDEVSLKSAINMGLKDKCHLKINCGMNRFGVNSELNMKILDNIMNEHDVRLKSVYTHFPNTASPRQTNASYLRFLKIKHNLTQAVPICFGGSEIIKYPFEFDMLRLGIGLYGYGQKSLAPVMKIKSYVCKTFYAVAGEFVGYGNCYRVDCDGKYAVVPVGYGDGLSRNLSGRFSVKINNKKYHAVGNICMDAFFVKIDESVKVGDEVVVMEDAEAFAKKLGTISYEVLTGFSSFRGKTKVE